MPVYGWCAFFVSVGILFIIAAVLMRRANYRPERKRRMDVHVHVHPARQRRESVYRRVKRKQEEQRKAYRESEWRQYGGPGPW